MVLIIIACVLLVIIVMAQNPKGGGLSVTFGGSSAQFGVQRTNDFMEKNNLVLAIIIVSLIFLSVVLTAKPSVQIKDVNALREKKLKLLLNQLHKLRFKTNCYEIIYYLRYLKSDSEILNPFYLS